MAKQNNKRIGFFPEPWERELNEHQQRIRKSILHDADMAIGSAVRIPISHKKHTKNLRSNPEVSRANCNALKFCANDSVVETNNLKFASRTFRKEEKIADWPCISRVEPSGRLRSLLVA